MLFEKLLIQEKRTMDGFRIKEMREVLTLDDLKERVDTVDELFTTIEVSTGQGICICPTNPDCFWAESES